jgi:hypothetical protein
MSGIIRFFSGQHPHRRIPLKIYHLDIDAPGLTASKGKRDDGPHFPFFSGKLLTP